MQLLTFENFASRANETFVLELGASSIDMTLSQVDKINSGPYPGMRREPFRLLFKCAALTILPQKNYAFRNAVLGRLSIFIVPVARARDGIVYEAVFN